MTYKKIERKHYNIHFIKTNKFKTVTVKVNLKRKLVKEDITKRNMLINSMLEATEHYPSKRLLEIKTEELYDLGYRGVNYASGIYTILCFEFNFINEKYIDDNITEEAFKFINELLFHPNISDCGFAKNNFNSAYNIMSEHLDTLKENATNYAQMRMFEEMDDSIISYRGSGYKEDLEKINSNNLYDYYKDVIENDIVDIFVIGDIKEEELIKLVENNLPFKTNSKSKESHYFNHNKVDDQIKAIQEKIDNEQSTLVLGFKIDKLSSFEKRYVLSCYNYILGSGTESNLFQIVREENSLCYYINSASQPLLGVNIIKAGIEAKDYDETIILINQELNKIKEGKFDDAKLNNAKTTYISSLLELEDSPDSIISLYMSHEYLNAELINERKKNIRRVTKKDIMALAKKIHLNTIFLLEGSDSNE